MRAYTRDEQRRLEAAQRAGGRLECPACGVALDLRPVPPSSAVSYVRDRVVVTCPQCRAHHAMDRVDARGGHPSPDGDPGTGFDG